MEIYFFSHGNANAKGTAILIKKKAKIQVNDCIFNPFGRFVKLKCKINNEEYVLANIYGPNQDDAQFFTEVTKQMDNLNVDLKIIAGDFNFYLEQIDKMGGQPNIHKMR